MNTTDLVNYVAKTNNLPKAQAKKILSGVFGTITSAVKKGQKVRIADFGSYTTAKRKARVGVNPSTGEKIKIAAKKVVKFNPSKNFKSLVK